MDTDNDAADDGAPDATEGVLDTLVGYRVRRAHGVFATDFARAVAGTGVRQVLFGILSVIDANPGINQGAAGRILGIQRANMVSLINETVDAGWIDRQVADDDRRAFALTLTAAGHEMLSGTLALIRAQEDLALADLSADERRTLLDLLHRIEPSGS